MSKMRHPESEAEKNEKLKYFKVGNLMTTLFGFNFVITKCCHTKSHAILKYESKFSHQVRITPILGNQNGKATYSTHLLSLAGHTTPCPLRLCK